MFSNERMEVLYEQMIYSCYFIKISIYYSFAGLCKFNINRFETSFCLDECVLPRLHFFEVLRGSNNHLAMTMHPAPVTLYMLLLRLTESNIQRKDSLFFMYEWNSCNFIKINMWHTFVGFCKFIFKHFETFSGRIECSCLQIEDELSRDEYFMWQDQKRPHGDYHHLPGWLTKQNLFWSFLTVKWNALWQNMEKDTWNWCFNHENWLITCKDMTILSSLYSFISGRAGYLKGDLISW